MKKLLSMILVAAMTLSLAACGKDVDGGTDVSADTGADVVADTGTDEQAETNADVAESTGLDEETPVTLTIYGPSVFSESGETGAIDAITGETTMGYDKLVERWNELHPNVTLNIEAIGWSDWRSAIQAAALGGGVDIIAHGGLIPELVEPLDDYIASEPELAEILYNIPRYNTDAIEGSRLDEPTVTSIPYNINPAVMVLNKRIFEDYGVDLPDETYTWSDVLELAEKLTGTDPVTGEQTYGFLWPNTSGTGSIKNFLLTASAYDAQVITYGETAKESTVDFTTQDAAKAFSMIAELAKYCSPDNIEGVETSRTIKENDTVAMSWSESGLSVIQSINTLGLEDEYIVMSMPIVEAGENAGQPCPYLGDGNFAISKTSENKEWAWEFIKFLMTDEVSAEYMVSNGKILNTVSGVSALEETIGSDYANMFLNILESLPEGYNSTTNAYYDNINFGSMSSYLSGELWELMKGNLTVEQAQSNVQAAVDDVFATMN